MLSNSHLLSKNYYKLILSFSYRHILVSKTHTNVVRSALLYKRRHMWTLRIFPDEANYGCICYVNTMLQHGNQYSVKGNNN